MTNCCRGLSCQVLPLRASRKDGALLKGERNSHENVQVAANWKPALQLTSLISVGEHVCAQSFFITTHTNKLTVSSLLCWLNWAQCEKKKKSLPFRKQQSCSGRDEKHAAEKPVWTRPTFTSSSLSNSETAKERLFQRCSFLKRERSPGCLLTG